MDAEEKLLLSLTVKMFTPWEGLPGSRVKSFVSPADGPCCDTHAYE